MPPSAATNQYPPPSGVAMMATIGELRCLPPIDPMKVAVPKENTPPSAPTSQYPPRSALAAMPTIGAFSLVLPSDPWNVYWPKLNTPPSPAKVQYPWPTVGLLPTTPVPVSVIDCGLAKALSVKV